VAGWSPAGKFVLNDIRQRFGYHKFIATNKQA
jgi:hypothetical protein